MSARCQLGSREVRTIATLAIDDKARDREIPMEALLARSEQSPRWCEMQLGVRAGSGEAQWVTRSCWMAGDEEVFPGRCNQ